MERYAISLLSPLGFLLEQPLTQYAVEGGTTLLQEGTTRQDVLTMVNIYRTQTQNQFVLTKECHKKLNTNKTEVEILALATLTYLLLLGFPQFIHDV
jgi:hypothetical protein